MKRRHLLKGTVGSAALTLFRVGHSAENTLRIVVPFPSGGSADLVARSLASPLSQRLSMPVWIDNRPGADGAIAAAHVASSPPDGKTLLMATYGAISALPHMRQHLPYVPESDLMPLAHMGQFSMMLFGCAKQGLQNFKDFQLHCQSDPQAFHYGTGNVASIVMGSWLSHHWHVDLTPVSYKGEVPAMIDLLSDRIQWMFATPTNAMGFVQQGKLVALANVAAQRHRLAPQVPSWKELGLEPFAAQAWGGVMGPAGLSEPVAVRYHQAINECISQEHRMVLDMQHHGFEPQTSTFDQLPGWIKHQSRAWQQAISDSGIQKV